MFSWAVAIINFKNNFTTKQLIYRLQAFLRRQNVDDNT